jgi:Holliday junction resolvase RusA-like endonuclease
LVAARAREVMQGRDPIEGPVSMRVVFHLGTRRRVDLDNLNKGLSDALTGIVYQDDSQVVNLHLVKRYHCTPGALVEICTGEVLPWN